MEFYDISSSILCKSAPDRRELEARVNHGFNNVELHLEPRHVCM